MTTPLVAVVMGSKSDAPLMQECLDLLSKLGIPHEAHVMSAHRTPDKVREFASSARERGIEVKKIPSGLLIPPALPVIPPNDDQLLAIAGPCAGGVCPLIPKVAVAAVKAPVTKAVSVVEVVARRPGKPDGAVEVITGMISRPSTARWSIGCPPAPPGFYETPRGK